MSQNIDELRKAFFSQMVADCNEIGKRISYLREKMNDEMRKGSDFAIKYQISILSKERSETRNFYERQFEYEASKLRSA